MHEIYICRKARRREEENRRGRKRRRTQAHTQNITHPAPEKKIERVGACEKEKEFWETSSFQTPPTK